MTKDRGNIQDALDASRAEKKEDGGNSVPLCTEFTGGNPHREKLAHPSAPKDADGQELSSIGINRIWKP